MKTLLSIVLSLGLLLMSAAHAQYTNVVRPIPADAPKAKMYVVSETVLNLNKKEYTLSPGCLIYSDANLIVQTQSLSGTYIVRVQFNQQGQLQKVWILNAAEDKVAAPWLGGIPFWQKLLPW